MPNYTFRDAQGKRYLVEVDEGVSESEAFRLFQQRPDRAPSDARTEDPTAGMSAFDKIAANVGAGTASTVRGLRQMAPGGADAAEVRAARARDERLAESIPGGGALQFAGELAPWLAVPAGAFVRGGRAALNAGRAALGTEKLASVAPRLGTAGAMADAGIAGAAAGASQPVTDDESRTWNMLMGGAGGAVLPGVAMIGRGARRMFTRKGAAERAAEDIIAQLGGDDAARAVAGKVNAYKPGAFVADVPLSTAEQAGDPALARLQMASQARGDVTPEGISWDAFKGEQAAQRWRALEDIAAPAGRVDELKVSRETATAPLREKALTAAGKDAWFHEPVAKAVDALLTGGSGASPAVQNVAGYVARELGNGITPERLYTVRKVLAAKLNGPGSDELAAAAKQSRAETMGLIKSIDEALNRASSNRWQKYLDRYIGESAKVDDARALAAIKEPFEREGATLTPQGVPVLTPRALGGAIERGGKNAWGDTLSYGSREALGQLMENLRRSEDLMAGVKRVGTSGGGSQTAMSLADLAKEGASALTGNWMTRAATQAGRERSFAFKRAALADALQNPDVFVAGVERKLAAGKPLTAGETAVLQIVRAAGIAPAAVATQ